jgi:hypothetical protein
MSVKSLVDVQTHRYWLDDEYLQDIALLQGDFSAVDRNYLSLGLGAAGGPGPTCSRSTTTEGRPCPRTGYPVPLAPGVLMGVPTYCGAYSSPIGGYPTGAGLRW